MYLSAITTGENKPSLGFLVGPFVVFFVCFGLVWVGLSVVFFLFLCFFGRAFVVSFGWAIYFVGPAPLV